MLTGFQSQLLQLEHPCSRRAVALHISDAIIDDKPLRRLHRRTQLAAECDRVTDDNPLRSHAKRLEHNLRRAPCAQDRKRLLITLFYQRAQPVANDPSGMVIVSIPLTDSLQHPLRM